MCKWYQTYYACLCDHNVKVVKPCSCYAERAGQSRHERLCDIFQHAKVPIILRDHCAVCAEILARLPDQPLLQRDAPRSALGHHYESNEVQDMPTVPVFSRWCGSEEFAVLEPQAFDSMFKLMESLLSLEGTEEDTVESDEEVPVVETATGQTALGEREMPVPAFSMDLVDRTRTK